jgi:hypothetical protein
MTMGVGCLVIGMCDKWILSIHDIMYLFIITVFIWGATSLVLMYIIHKVYAIESFSQLYGLAFCSSLGFACNNGSCVSQPNGMYQTQSQCQAACESVSNLPQGYPQADYTISSCPIQTGFATCRPTKCGTYYYKMKIARVRGYVVHAYWNIDSAGFLRFDNRNSTQFILEPITHNYNLVGKYIKLSVSTNYNKFIVRVSSGRYDGYYLAIDQVQSKTAFKAVQDRSKAIHAVFMKGYIECDGNARFPEGKGCPKLAHTPCFPAIFYEHCSLGMYYIKNSNTMRMGYNKINTWGDFNYVTDAHNDSPMGDTHTITMLDTHKRNAHQYNDYTLYSFPNNKEARRNVCSMCPSYA